MSKMKKISKHYRLPENLINRLKIQSGDRFATEVDAVIYFLKKGLQYDEASTKQEKILFNLNRNIKDIRFMKKLLIQLFVNNQFLMNVKLKDDEMYNDFLSKYYKDNFID